MEEQNGESKGVLLTKVNPRVPSSASFTTIQSHPITIATCVMVVKNTEKLIDKVLNPTAWNHRRQMCLHKEGGLCSHSVSVLTLPSITKNAFDCGFQNSSYKRNSMVSFHKA